MSKVLYLNADRMPMRPSTISVRHAIQLCLRGKVRVLAHHPDETYHVGGTCYPVPTVVVLMAYVSIPRNMSKTVSNPLLFARDGYRCQYCGRHKDELRPNVYRRGKLVRAGERLTCDHMKPVSRFTGTEAERRVKASTWENCVTACSTCNEAKGSLLPWEAGMRLISDKAPRRPMGILIIIRGHLDAEQEAFLEPYAAKQMVLYLAH